MQRHQAGLHLAPHTSWGRSLWHPPLQTSVDNFSPLPSPSPPSVPPVPPVPPPPFHFQLRVGLPALREVQLGYERGNMEAISAASPGWPALAGLIRGLDLRVYPGPLPAQTLNHLGQLGPGLTRLAMSGVCEGCAGWEGGGRRLVWWLGLLCVCLGGGVNVTRLAGTGWSDQGPRCEGVLGTPACTDTQPPGAIGTRADTTCHIRCVLAGTFMYNGLLPLHLTRHNQSWCGAWSGAWGDC